MSKKAITILAASVGMSLAHAFAAAQQGGMNHGSMGQGATGQPGMMQMQPGELTVAEVRKVDKDAQKITLKHGEIKNLDMPPMTMVFQVKDVAMLEAVKKGDKVRFSADKVGGAYTVTSIEKTQ